MMAIPLTWLFAALLERSYRNFAKSNLTFTPLSFDLALYNIVLCLNVVNITIIPFEFLFEARS